MLVLSGPEGIGKSRLYRELKWHAQLQLRVVEGSAFGKDGVSGMVQRALDRPNAVPGIDQVLLARQELARSWRGVLALDDAGFRALFAGSPIKRIGRNRMVRNCLIAAGNSGDAALIGAVRPHLDDADPMVAEAARWALGELQPAPMAAMH